MLNSTVKTIGILTSGGDAPGLNAAIRGVCYTCIEKYGIKVVGFRDGYRGLISGDSFAVTKENISDILAEGGTFLGTSRCKPFKKPVEDPETGLLPVDAIKKNYKKFKLDALVVLGGNGTNSTASLLAQEGLNVIGLPKTIDNDIVGTDVTFGFHTAVDVATEAIDRIRSTARSHGRVMVVEVMGHKAGWLGLYSAIASGADACLIPEIPYEIGAVAKAVNEVRNSGKGFSIIVVAEGALSVDEAKMDKKAFKRARAAMPQSIGYRVAKELEEATGAEVRVSVLGYLQRGGTPSPYDRVLATQFGTTAAEMLVKGEFGNLVAMQNNEIVGIPLETCAGKVKNIPAEHPLIQTGRSVGICFGD
ncbi:MAG: 6-phosphofructokinase [Treponema sp.]|nr:6-phosphofructokinase [Treponema sp.]